MNAMKLDGVQSLPLEFNSYAETVISMLRDKRSRPDGRQVAEAPPEHVHRVRVFGGQAQRRDCLHTGQARGSGEGVQGHRCPRLLQVAQGKLGGGSILLAAVAHVRGHENDVDERRRGPLHRRQEIVEAVRQQNARLEEVLQPRVGQFRRRTTRGLTTVGQPRRRCHRVPSERSLPHDIQYRKRREPDRIGREAWR
ncbi:unnamed protein product [Ectocarpus sp. 6 AP-2014]